jgi:hypothetical protein
MGENTNAYRFLVGELEERGNLEDVDVDGKMILKPILRKYDQCIRLHQNYPVL